MSNHRRTQLENGIRVVTDSMPGTRSASIGVLVEVGAVSPSDCPSGIAHLCEHLIFQGTSNRDAMEIARLMDSAGGHVGGFVNRDYTCFHGVVLAEFQTFVLDLLGDVLLNPIFPHEALAREQRAIAYEIEAAADDPEQRGHQLVKELAWRGDPLGHSITGRADEIAAVTREDLIYFAHSRYVPDRMVIAAAGNLDHDDFVAHVRDAFWRLIPGDSEEAPFMSARFRSGLKLEQKPLSQAYFALAVEAPEYAHPTRFAVHVFSQVLGGGISSRLYRLLRESTGLVYSVSSTYHAYRRGGMLLIEGSTAPEHLMDVLRLALTELKAICAWQRPIDAEELQRSKAQLRAQTVLASEDSHSRMSRLATQELYLGEYASEGQILAQIDAVDRTDLEQLATGRMLASTKSLAAAIVAPDVPEAYDRNRLCDLLQELRVTPRAKTIEKISGSAENAPTGAPFMPSRSLETA